MLVLSHLFVLLCVQLSDEHFSFGAENQIRDVGAVENVSSRVTRGKSHVKQIITALKCVNF